MIGEIGRVESVLAPRGKITVHGELWEAVSREPVSPGDLVRVRSVEGLTLQVEPVSSSHPGPPKQESKAESETSQETSKGA
jgi:membrane-bound ClpP family serine protease